MNQARTAAAGARPFRCEALATSAFLG